MRLGPERSSHEGPRDGERALVACAERRLGCPVRGAEPLDGGDEALVLRIETPDGPLVLHASPPWRTRAELEWVHAVAQFAQRRVPQVVAPLAIDGETVFAGEERLFALFPWIAGRTLDRDDPDQRADAARLLATIHQALLAWPRGERPPSGAARRVVGIIDWHDAVIRPLALETAGATYELCKDGQGGLWLDRADAFVRTYLDAGGPLSACEHAALPSLMRLWVRNDVRSSLACSGSLEDAYVKAQLRAFRELRACGWDPSGRRG